jgi:hypothetical protein
MPEIVLTEEQARIVEEAGEKVSVRDPRGAVIAVIDPIDVMALRKWRERRDRPQQPGIPSERVQAHMRALEEEWQRKGGFDQAYALEFLARLREQDQP